MNGILWKGIVGAAERRHIAMPGELAGYLVLGVVDGLSGQSGRVACDDIQLSDDGRVVLLRVRPCDRALSDRCMRSLLRTLLDVSSSPSPALVRAALPLVDGAAATFVTELQTALIPVNRGAARRALARLYRELARIPRLAERDDDPRRPEQPRGTLGVTDVARRVDEKGAVLATIESNVNDTPSEEFGEVPSGDESHRVLPAIARTHGPEDVLVEFVEIDMDEELSEEKRAVPGAASAGAALAEIPDLEVPATALATSQVGAVVMAPRHPSVAPCLNADGCVATPAKQIEEPPALFAVCGGVDEPPIVPSEIVVIRETTLVMAPVVSKPRVEQTERLAVGAVATRVESTTISSAIPTRQSDVCELTMALPLVTRRRPAPRQIEDEASLEPAKFDMTFIDAVVEISDEEITYEEIASDELWLDIDCSDERDFETVLPPVVPFDQNPSCAECCASEEASDFFSPREEFPVAVESAELLAVDADMASVSGSCIERLCESACMSSEFAVRIEPMTLYRSGDVGDKRPRSTVGGLSEQFTSEPLWAEVELCRSLRSVAGLDLSPVASVVQTHTPPPTVSTVAGQSLEQAEPTRRLRKLAALVAVLFAAGAGAYSVGSLGGSVASASQPSMDALGQICRATVSVGGVGSRQGLRIRQVGDLRFRGPTRITDTTASFVGLRCGQDAELLVDGGSGAGLRRIPISGIRLQPLGMHPWVNIELRLDGTT